MEIDSNAVTAVAVAVARDMTVLNDLIASESVVSISTESSEEFVGPLAGWLNARSYGATGNGVTDDTDAIQAAINAAMVVGGCPVLFLPAGKYLISSTLTLLGCNGVSIVGTDPATTFLMWRGASGGTMIRLNGVAYCRVTRFTLDGNNTAGLLIDQSSDQSVTAKQLFFDTGNQYADCILQNAGIGIQCGAKGGAAEGTVIRCVFSNITQFGLIVKNFNALDWWVWFCTFNNVNVALSNNPGAGAFHAYGCTFNSPNNLFDITMLNTDCFNVRDCYSQSKQFMDEVFFYTNAAPTRLQSNVINMPMRTDGWSGDSVYMGNMGALVLTDNIFQSPAGLASPPAADNAPVLLASEFTPDYISVGDMFTLSSPINVNAWSGTTARSIVIDQTMIVPSSLTVPNAPVFLPNLNRPVIEVPAGANEANIQAAINQAAAMNGQRPIVHIPHGTYQLAAGLVIPACDLQLIGDGFTNTTGTIFVWSGKGAAITLQGPSHATLREFYINAGIGTGILIQDADQQGARIFASQLELMRSTTANLFVDGIDHTLVECRDIATEFTCVSPAATGIAVCVRGGPLAAAGTPAEGKTVILSGSAGANYVTHKVYGGGNLTVRDMWYEGPAQSTYAEVSDNSIFMLEGSRVALPTPNGPAFVYTNFSGKSTLLCSAPDNKISIDAASTGNVWVVGCNFSVAPEWGITNAGSSQACFNMNRQLVTTGSNPGSVPLPDIGSPSNAWMLSMLEQLRHTHPSVIDNLPVTVTDIRVYRVEVELGAIGLHITA